jgi:hypothetical protein
MLAVEIASFEPPGLLRLTGGPIQFQLPMKS